MNTKRFVMSAIGLFGFIFAFEFVLHHKLLHDMYVETAHLWRPEGEGNMCFMFGGQIAFAFILAFIFTRHHDGMNVGEGCRFGLLIGLLLASLEIGKYTFMPISLTLTLAWTVGALLKGVGSGIVLSMIYRR